MKFRLRTLTAAVGTVITLAAAQSSAQYSRELASLAPADGYIVSSAGGGLLIAMGAGDFNGDGLDDLIVGQPNAGQATLVLGTQSTESIDLESADAAFRLSSGDPADRLGIAVAPLGDINNDGFDDVIIGAPGTASDTGAAHILFGTDQPGATTLTPADLTGSIGFTLSGVTEGDQLGAAVAGGQDLSGDGVADMVLAAPFADTGATDSGDVFVVYGASNIGPVDLAVAAPTFTKISGLAAEDHLGTALAVSENINVSGPADLLIGAPGVNGASVDAGAGYGVFGVNGGLGSNVDLGDLDGSNGFAVSGDIENGLLGLAISAIGDINGDGLGDMAFGAPGADAGPELGAGKAYVVNGAATFSATISAESIDAPVGFVAQGPNGLDGFGAALSAAGDLNADGFDDLAVGAAAASPAARIQAGRVHVIYGSSTPVSSPLNPLSLDGRRGVTFNGAAADEGSGVALAGPVDVNADGISDLLIATRDGRVYGVNGEATRVEEILPPPGAPATSRFGSSVDISNNQMVVSLAGGDSAAVYRLGGSTPVFQGLLTLPAGFTAFDFGAPVSVSGATIAIGARAGTVGLKGVEPQPVSVAIFQRTPDGNGFTFSQAIGGNQGSNGVDSFGRSLDLSGNTLVVGAPTDNENEAQFSGAVYVFTRPSEFQQFTLVRKIKPPQPTSNAQFGSAVRINGSLLAVGAPTADPSGLAQTGQVYLYDLADDPLSLPRTAVGSFSGTGAAFGSAVNFDGPTQLLVGAPFESDGPLASSGAAYVFDIGNGELLERQRIRPREVAQDNAFGLAVEINDRRVAIGAPGADTVGAIYLFRRDAQGQFMQQSRIGALQGQGSLGTTVGISGDRVLGGAPLTSGSDGSVLLLVDPSRLFADGFEG